MEERENVEKQTMERRRPLWHRFLRWAGLLLLCPILLVMLLTVLFYLPPVQEWAVGIATKKISEATGKKVSIERLRITPLLDVELSDLLILCSERLADADLQLQRVDRSETYLHTDTLVHARHCIVDLDLSSLLDGQIAVDAFDLRQARVDTQDMLDEMVLDGNLDRFSFDVHDVNLNARQADVRHARIDACDIDIAMRDTLVLTEDTTTAEIPWKLCFSHVSMKDSRVIFHTIRDTMAVRADVSKLTLDEGNFDLERQVLHVEDLDAKVTSITYDLNYEPWLQGVDFNHLQFTAFETSLDELDYDLLSSKLHTRLDRLKARERCGFEVSHLSVSVDLDTTKILLREVELCTPNSHLRAEADMEWAALAPHRRGRMDAVLSADLSKQDVMLLAGIYVPKALADKLPEHMVTAEVQFAGNIDSLELRSLRLKMPEMLDVTMKGAIGNLMDTRHLNADIHVDAQTWDLSLLQKMLGLTSFSIPALSFVGDAQVQDGDYKIKGDMAQGGGRVNLDAHYNTEQDSYAAMLDVKNLRVTDFIPMDSLVCLTAKADLKGRGTDFLSPHSTMRALLDVTEARYGSRDISRVHLDALMQQGYSFVNLRSDNEVLDADGCLEVQVDGRKIKDANFSVDMHGIDLYSLGITEKPLNIAMAMHANGHTDLRDHHWLSGSVNAISLQTADTIYYPKDIRTELLVQPDTLFAFLSAGDLELHMNGRQGLQGVIDCGLKYWEEMNRQVREKDFNQLSMRQYLPDVDLCVESGRQNPLANIAAALGYTYQAFDVDIHTDTIQGINGHGWIHTVNTGAVVLDTIQFSVAQNGKGMELDGRVCNSKRNPDITFDARLKAMLSPHDASLNLVYYDDKGRKGVDLGAQAQFHNHTMRVHLDPLRPILAYRYFTLNADNFLSIDSVGRIDANLDLLADDGTGLKVYATPNELAEQDITVSINQLNLGELCSVLPYMPLITGYLHGDAHLQKTDSVISVGVDLKVHDMHYEGCPMGDVGINAAYMPNEDGTHYVDGFLSQNDAEVLAFSGMYQTQAEGDDHINLDADLQRFPLATVNGFLGDMVQLAGNFSGEIHVEGPTSRPAVEGRVLTESMHILSPNYSVDLRVPDDTISIERNRMDLSLLKAYSTGTRPLQLGGYIDFADLERIRLDVSATARNFELINAPKNHRAEAYGKVFVNLNLLVNGLLNDLNVTGNLNVLGNTDLTYVLKDSPITVEDEMADLVEFVDFSDTVEVVKPSVESPSNLNMRLGISIDQATQLHCLLSEDGVNYANIEGGGDLTMTYDERKGLQLFGRYTILQGRMTYTMMVMALKDCDIANGSYVDFSGDPFNPRLSILATERLNSTVVENETPRSVAFDVGLNISKTLNDMGLEFTLEAPEDVNLQNEIAQMTPEQRGRVAVTLMATGMYIVEGNTTGGFNTTNALNSFINSQISQIAGKALNTIDLSLGVQNTNTASGNITTDYSFRFAKRFWGNRISLILGGKVSSGSEAENTSQTIIDNVSIEYRLDKSATRYVNIYYDNNYESILEGRVTEMGAGLVLRRKTTHLGELFLFRKEDKLLREGKEKKKGGKL